MLQLFGQIDNPLNTSFNSYGNLEEGGLILFVSNLIKFATIVGGIVLFINVVIAGYMYMTGGDDPKNVTAAWTRITYSIIGLTIIVSAYVIAAITGLVLFGDARAILNPQIYGPGTVSGGGDTLL